MKPYYETELGKLYHGDCLQIMPELEPVDLVLTDPPYGLGEKWTGGTWFTKNVYESDKCEWDKTQDERVEFIIGLGLPSIIWGGNYYNLKPSRCYLSWVKRDNMPTMADFELAWTNFDRPSKEYYNRRNGWVRKHPTEKPVALFIWCIGWSKINGVTIDPFFGSGTTAIACERLNRKWIGIEIEEKYCEIAAKRIEAERKQLKLF